VSNPGETASYVVLDGGLIAATYPNDALQLEDAR
jgi:hypothetical protein